jgi:hypothetical protein
MYKNYPCNPPMGMCPPCPYLETCGMDCMQAMEPAMYQPMVPMETYMPEYGMECYPQMGAYPCPFMPATEMVKCPHMPMHCPPMPCPPMPEPCPPPKDNVAEICEKVYEKVCEIDNRLDQLCPKIMDMHEKIDDIYKHMHGKR